MALCIALSLNINPNYLSLLCRHKPYILKANMQTLDFNLRGLSLILQSINLEKQNVMHQRTNNVLKIMRYYYWLKSHQKKYSHNHYESSFQNEPGGHYAK